MMQLHVLSILVSNHFGVLMRVTTIFSRRTCNIKSLTVGETDDPAVSRITILMEGTEDMAYQIEKLLKKQEDVIKAVVLPMPQLISRELLLIKVKNHPELMDRLAGMKDLRPRILDSDDDSAIIEVSGELRDVNRFIEDMQEFGAIEICRTGVASLGAGKKTIYEI